MRIATTPISGSPGISRRALTTRSKTRLASKLRPTTRERRTPTRGMPSMSSATTPLVMTSSRFGTILNSA